MKINLNTRSRKIQRMIISSLALLLPTSASATAVVEGCYEAHATRMSAFRTDPQPSVEPGTLIPIVATFSSIDPANPAETEDLISRETTLEIQAVALLDITPDGTTAGRGPGPGQILKGRPGEILTASYDVTNAGNATAVINIWPIHVQSDGIPYTNPSGTPEIAGKLYVDSNGDGILGPQDSAWAVGSMFELSPGSTARVWVQRPAPPQGVTEYIDLTAGSGCNAEIYGAIVGDMSMKIAEGQDYNYLGVGQATQLYPSMNSYEVYNVAAFTGDATADIIKSGPNKEASYSNESPAIFDTWIESSNPAATSIKASIEAISFTENETPPPSIVLTINGTPKTVDRLELQTLIQEAIRNSAGRIDIRIQVGHKDDPIPPPHQEHYTMVINLQAELPNGKQTTTILSAYPLPPQMHTIIKRMGYCGGTDTKACNGLTEVNDLNLSLKPEEAVLINTMVCNNGPTTLHDARIAESFDPHFNVIELQVIAASQEGGPDQTINGNGIFQQPDGKFSPTPPTLDSSAKQRFIWAWDSNGDNVPDNLESASCMGIAITGKVSTPKKTATTLRNDLWQLTPP